MANWCGAMFWESQVRPSKTPTTTNTHGIHRQPALLLHLLIDLLLIVLLLSFLRLLLLMHFLAVHESSPGSLVGATLVQLCFERPIIAAVL
jgi:hypothetical protein